MVEYKFKKAILLIMLLLAIPVASARVVVFRDYTTQTTLEKGSLHIERIMTLENIGSAPIIPGELHFKLHEIVKDEQVASEVSNLVAESEQGRQLSTDIINGNRETDLIIDVWDTLLPGFYYTIKMEYDVQFKSKGVLFYLINIPTEETTIPIRHNTQKFLLPKRFSVTFAPGAEVSKSDDKRVVEWVNQEDMQLEYSIVPFPKLPIKGVNVFWAILIVLLVGLFIGTRVRHSKKQFE